MTADVPVLVLVEANAGTPTRASLQAVAAARALAQATGCRAEAVAFGAEAAEAAAAYLEVIHEADLPQDNQESRVRALGAALTVTGAEVLILAATRTAGAVAPRVAIRADGALLDEVTSLTVDGDAVVATRLAQLQRVRETVRAHATPVVATTKVGAFEPADARDARGEVRNLPVAYEAADARVAVGGASAAGGARLGLEEADVVVAGGRGLGTEDAFDTLVVPLADRLGAAIGATRAVVDAGWRPYDEQIGQTGKTVSPGLYLALGVSGAVQHLSGMNRSRRVIAINKDADAPIFRHCDVGVVGDVHEVVPALLDALGQRDG